MLIPQYLYNWILSLHIISVIAFMAGIMYLPRLFIYHIETENESKESERVANGRLTCAEALGHKEFVMTKLYRSA